MPHILNKIIGAKFKNVKKQLEKDAPIHAKQGMYLEHLWINSDNPKEILFLFRVDDLSQCKKFMREIYEDTKKENSNVKLPEKIFLEGD